MRTPIEIRAMQKKLRKAFQALRDEGVLARMDFCQNSSFFDSPPPSDKCLVFYGARDLEFYKETGILVVHFSTPDGDLASTRALGEQVRILLEWSGLEVEWDGDPNQALAVLDCVES